MTELIRRGRVQVGTHNVAMIQVKTGGACLSGRLAQVSAQRDVRAPAAFVAHADRALQTCLGDAKGVTARGRAAPTVLRAPVRTLQSARARSRPAGRARRAVLDFWLHPPGRARLAARAA
jgi:hypothetical protein